MIDNSGPAFPTCVSADNEGGLNHGMPGMSLRDYFAGQAMVGILRSAFESIGTERESPEPQSVALDAYRMADAMLAARGA